MELGVLRETHIRELRNRGKSQETIRFYRQSYKELENYLGADSPKAADVETLDRNDFYGMMDGMRERGCVPGSIHAIMRGLRASFNWAYEEEYISTNPIERVKLPSVPRKLQEAVQPDMAERVWAGPEILRCTPSLENGPRACDMFKTRQDGMVRGLHAMMVGTRLRKEGDMVTLGLLVRLEAKPGKEADVENFLKGGLPLVEQEPATTAWFAIRLGPSTFGIFDVFPDESGREAHLSGRVAAGLKENADLFAQAPEIEKLDVVAAKLPGVLAT